MILQAKRHVQWPRRPPPLTLAQRDAREQYMRLWHEELPKRYAAIEDFNHGWVARLPHEPHIKTLEIGAGLGSHLAFENLKDQEYYCLELRPEFCAQLARKISPEKVICGDIQQRLSSPDHSWDRIIAIHTLEHVLDLPKVLAEVKRLLNPRGILDVVIPCEGGWAHTFARAISAKRLFEKRFKMSFLPIHKNEHVSEFPEIITLLLEEFRVEASRFYPLYIPLYGVNLCVGLRLRLPS